MSWIHKKARKKMGEEKARYIECMIALKLLEIWRDADIGHIYFD